MQTFDYIIAGGGTAGCVLAARLSEDPAVSVLLLEPGERNSAWTRLPVAFRYAIYRAGLTWPLTSEPEPALDGRRTPLLAGRTLGGSSTINGMLYVRGQRQDFDGWDALGATGWSTADVSPYFERIEQQWPLSVVQDPRLLQADFARALDDAGFVPVDDPLHQPADGYFLPRITVDSRGRRRGSAQQHRLALQRSNVTVWRGARVTKVTMDRGSATGVECLHAGQAVRVQAGREVVLAAGSYHSPQLLMLSGIGRASDLEAHGVVVHCDLPGAGTNLSNHGSLAMRFAASRPLPAMQALRLDRAALSALAWAVLGRGFFTLQPTSQHLMLRTRPGLEAPDCQVTLGTLGIDADWWLPHFKPRVPHAFVANMTLLRPASRGWVRLASADPLAAPRVLTNLFGDAGDRAAVCDCVRIVRQLFQRDALAQWTRREWLPGDAVQSDAQIEQWLRRAAAASGHPVGTCRMGDDPDAVVDPQLRVRGVANLRVIDASVMPSLPGAGTYASTLMVAERGADLLRGRVLPAAAANVVPFPRHRSVH